MEILRTMSDYGVGCYLYRKDFKYLNIHFSISSNIDPAKLDDLAHVEIEKLNFNSTKDIYIGSTNYPVQEYV